MFSMQLVLRSMSVPTSTYHTPTDIGTCVINKNQMCAFFFLITCFSWNGYTIVSMTALKFPENFTFGASTLSHQIEGVSNVDGKHFSKESINKETTALKFPENFTFGASSSSYQIEGAWNVDGKGENIWDRLTHTKPDTIKDRQNGDDAAESYYLFRNDSDLLKEIGFDMYRFSISWTRILPNGDLSEINRAGIQHYNDVIDDLLEKNIEPMVTMYHWDLPQKLQDHGGWLNSSIVDHMVNYADILFSNFGDRVKWWSTMNEPLLIVYGYSNNNSNAPSLNLGTPSNYIITHNILLAHMRTYRLYEKKYKSKQNGRVSISLNYDACFPKTGSQQDIEATERHYQFSIGIFAHPIYSTDGNYPKLVREIVFNNSKKEGLPKSRLPEFTEEEIILLKGASDYFSFNHFTSWLCSSVSQNEHPYKMTPFFQDMNVHRVRNCSLPVTESPKMEINPKGFKLALHRISTDYNFPEIFVTENGYGDTGEINDTSRIEYLHNYLGELLEAYYYENCKIIGYMVWSILDNFEWTTGYEYGDFQSLIKDIYSMTQK